MRGSHLSSRALRVCGALAAALLALDAAAQTAGADSRTVESAGSASRRALAAALPAAEVDRARPELRYKDTPPPPGLWRRSAGKWATAAGVVLLAAGATVAVLNDRLAGDLDAKYSDNRLTAADAPSYDRIDTYNVVSMALLAAGGAVTGTGLVLWATAPDARGKGAAPAVGVRGRF